MVHLRVCVKWKIVIKFDYSRVVKFFVDCVLSASVPEKTIIIYQKHHKNIQNELEDSRSRVRSFILDQNTSNSGMKIRAGVAKKG